MAPIPAGPKIIEITRLGMNGNCTWKIKIEMNHNTPPTILFTITFFKKNSKKIVIMISPIIIKIISGVNVMGNAFSCGKKFVAISANPSKINAFIK